MYCAESVVAEAAAASTDFEHRRDLCDLLVGEVALGTAPGHSLVGGANFTIIRCPIDGFGPNQGNLRCYDGL